MGILPENTIIRCLPSGVSSGSGVTKEEMHIFALIGDSILFAYLIQLSGLDPNTASDLVKALEQKRLVELTEGRTSRKEGKAKTKEKKNKTILEKLQDDECKSGLKAIPKSDRQEILLLAENIKNLNYYEVLEVERDADAEEIKLAFFAKSKRFHPDRYFEKRIDDYRDHLQLVFNTLNTAYRTLKNPKKRSEYNKTLPSDKKKTHASTATRRQRANWIKSMAKAEQYYKAGLKELESGNLMSAETSIKLACKLQPNKKVYQEKLKFIESKTAEYKAEKILKKAEAQWDAFDRDNAADLFEQALCTDPENWKVNLGYARALVTLKSKKHLNRAKELAQKAVKNQPANLEVHCVLAEIYKKLGMDEEARQELKMIDTLGPSSGKLEKLKDRFKGLF